MQTHSFINCVRYVDLKADLTIKEYLKLTN